MSWLPRNTTRNSRLVQVRRYYPEPQLRLMLQRVSTVAPKPSLHKASAWLKSQYTCASPPSSVVVGHSRISPCRERPGSTCTRVHAEGCWSGSRQFCCLHRQRVLSPALHVLRLIFLRRSRRIGSFSSSHHLTCNVTFPRSSIDHFLSFLPKH